MNISQVKLHKLKIKLKKAETMICQLLKAQEANTIMLDSEMNSDFVSIMTDHNHHIINTDPKDSFQHIF